MLDPIFWASLGIALSILLAAIGAGLGIGMAGPGVAGAITEKPEIFARSFIAVVLAEALAIYGLVVALLAVFKLPAIAANRSNFSTTRSAIRCTASRTYMPVWALDRKIGVWTSGVELADGRAENA